MKIKSMTATFGCLNHATLELEEGLNLMSLPNEQGKSTWCAFLRVMLYGLSTRERDKKGFLADKTRYQPWNGAPMEGELVCTWQGREIRIRRYTKGAAPMGACEITYADSGEPVPGLSGSNLGDVLIGVGREVFERSAFLNQANLSVSQTPELEKRLAALVSSGEEGVSASQVQRQMLDWQRRRQYRSRGEIPELERRRADTAEALEAQKDTTAQIRKSQLELDRLEELKKELERQERLHQAHSQAGQAQAYQQAQQELAQAGARLEELEARLPGEHPLPEREALERARDEVAYLRTLGGSLKAAQRELAPAAEALEQAERACADPVFTGTGEEARTRAGTDAGRLTELERQGKTLNSQCGVCIGAGIGGAVIALAAVCVVTGGFHPAALASLLLAALGIALGMSRKSKRKALAAQYQAILDTYGAKSAREITEGAENYCRRLAEADRARENLTRAERAAAELEAQYQATWDGLKEFTAGFAPEVQDVFGFSAAITKALTVMDAVVTARRQKESAEKLFAAVAARGQGERADGLEQPSLPLDRVQAALAEARQRIAAAESERAMALGRRSTLGDPEMFQAELERIDGELLRKNEEYAALEIALEAMAQAEAEMRDRFSPELNRIAGAYFRRLTRGRYEAVRLNREMEASADEPGSVATRGILSLSRGTADQLWLAVRLAVCELALPGEDPCPLVLDDALASFDDDRAGLALELLRELSGKRQILLFTCHSRERELCAQL